jgi:hypothetical protein
VKMLPKLKTKFASFEKVRKSASPMLAAEIGLFTSIPSRVVRAGPFKNVRVVPEATSESHRADGHAKFVPPVADVSSLKVIEFMVAVTVPLEPVNKVPATDAEADGIAEKKAQLSPTMGRRFLKILFTCFLSSN